ELAKRPRIGVIKKETRNGIPIVTAGMVENVHEILTKKGDRMGFVAIGDGMDSIELVAFPEVYKTHHHLFVVGSCVAVQGKLSMRNEEPTVVIDRIKALGASSKEEPRE
ncbi:DNA polymerase III subunit alpha, partial [sediment metagenome]